MNKIRLYWLCQIFGWGLYELLQLMLFSVAGDLDLQFVVGQLIQLVFYILITHLFRWVILHFQWLQLRWFWMIPRIVFSNFLMGVVHYFILLGITWVMGTLVVSKDLSILTIMANVLQSMVIFFFWSLLYLSFHYFERYNRSLQYEAALKEIELTNLRSQLNPHFIFNALNSIRALVDENPVNAKQAITQLSSILRNSLNSDRQNLIPFMEELKFVQDYLSLESIRFEERIQTKYEIDPSSGQFQIPPLMLQTLVENGIKHGISTLKNGGLISITTKLKPNGLLLTIKNSGKYLHKKSGSIGYGLENTRKRLQLIYGDKATFRIENAKNDTVITEILIPKQ